MGGSAGRSATTLARNPPTSTSRATSSVMPLPKTAAAMDRFSDAWRVMACTRAQRASWGDKGHVHASNPLFTGSVRDASARFVTVLSTRRPNRGWLWLIVAAMVIERFASAAVSGCGAVSYQRRACRDGW